MGERGTSRAPAALRGAQRGGEALARRPEFGWLARAGLLARGVVYGIIGILAVKLATGSGGRITNQQGALQTIARQSFGEVLLIAVAAGLGGYAAWRLIRAAIGHGRQEADSAFDRVAALASGLVYGALCVTAVKILSGASAGGGSSAPKKTTAGVLGWPGGPVIVGAVGVVLIGVALYQAYEGLARKFLEKAETARMSRRVKRAYATVGVFGHLARMVVFALTGYGLLMAAIDYEPQKAIGLDGALNELAENSYGPILLGIVAVGLIGFALYSIADARYRKI
ncbi:MAG: DUF1206 domain-containing protein [Solirubrobacterales bacterium]|nr:DUF1206 domain-containing protein [Solirubrobacterales bacterium]